MKKTTLNAYLEIWNPQLDIRVETVEECTPSIYDAAEQLESLNKKIASWTSNNNGIVLETTGGWIRFPAEFISNSLIRLKVVEVNHE